MAQIRDFRIKYHENSEDAIGDQEVIIKKIAWFVGLDFKCGNRGWEGRRIQLPNTQRAM